MPIALHMSVGQDHPRIRGEHKPGKSDDAFDAGSSPHTRGARYSSSRWSIRRGIIPAYAGSTAFAIQSPSMSSDHPRIRGEHGAVGENSLRRRGSSPHTRGARCGARLDRGVRRIIPAYAGSTPPSVMKVTL